MNAVSLVASNQWMLSLWSEFGEIDPLVEVFHLRLELQVGELLTLEVFGDFHQFTEPLGNGRLGRVGEQVARPEHFDQPEGNRGPNEFGVKLAAGLHWQDSG